MERDAISEFTNNADLMRRVNSLAQKDPRLAEIRSQLMKSASGESLQDPQAIISASITVLTNMAIRGDQEMGREALSARDEVFEIAQSLPFKGKKRHR